MNDEILKLAKEQSYQEGYFFSPCDLEAFYNAAFNAGLEAAAKVVAPSEEHRREASGFLGGDEGVALLDGCVESIRDLEKK